MKNSGLGCQVCLTKYIGVSCFKKHVRSMEHRQKMANVFQKDKFKVNGFIPSITVIKPLLKQPIVGLSLLTVCFSPETPNLFYLCHACKEKCPTEGIVCHLFSSDHCSNYFCYTNPNVLSFAWLPSMNMRVILKSELTEEVSKNGLGQPQMLHLPDNLLKKLSTCTYSEVMHTLSENDKLLKLLEAVEPKRTMIQTYHEDRNRKHPLLGMQHLVECICVGPTDKRYYLCTLCKLTLATHMIIKHVLSFDHIFCHFRAWHPSTLLSRECYTNYTMSFASMILDIAKQSEELHGTANTNMKQVNLEPAKYTSINFTCYAEALKDLESITKEQKESSLITSVQPGSKLAPLIKCVSNAECGSVSAGSVKLSYKIRCQDCNVIFKTIFLYVKHLSNWKHKEMLKKAFRAQIDDGFDQTELGWKLNLGLYTYIIESLKQNQPAIGVPLVVTCVSTQAQEEAIYVCFACKESFTEDLLRQHFNSRKHLIHTLLYQNPWRLSFAWENHVDVKLLRSMAWEEEKERGPNQMMMKVLDIPSSIFCPVPLSFSKVIKRLELHHTLLKREVPQCETYSKLKQNERFPLLGKQFLVMHDVCVSRHQPTEMGCLCLLCERRLSHEECYAHLFSREHVAVFLNRFHPDSLNSSTDPETLLDLAKQAARIHPVSHVQVIKLDRPIWEPCSYQTAISILACVKRKNGNGKLEPPITPTFKLVSRKTLKHVDHVRDSSQENGRMMEGSEEKTSEKSTDNSQTSMKNISVEVGAEILNTQTPTPSEKESEGRREVFSKTSSEEIKNAGIEAGRAIKEEKIEEPAAKETIESCLNTDKDDETEIKAERCTSSKDALTQENERKRPSSMEKEMDHKRQRLTSKQGASCEEPQNLPSSEQKEATTADEGGSGKPSHETAKDKASSVVDHQQAPQLWQYINRKNREPVVGLSALLECHCDQRDPIYLCACCSLMIPEKDIIGHVTGVDHQKMYLEKLLPPPEGKTIRHYAALFEQDNGFGEAQVVGLDEDIYNKISKQNFKSAMQMVKALYDQQDSWRELPSTSDLSGVQPVDTSVTLHARHEGYSATDYSTVVAMEVDDSEGCEAQPSSVAAAVSVKIESSSNTTEVPPESNEDVKMTQIKVSESADDTNACLTVSRSSEDTSSRHVSTSGTNTTCLQPNSTGKNLKGKLISNSTVGPQLKIATTSKIMGTSQYAATSNSIVTTPPTSTTDCSECTAKSFTSTPHTTKSTAPISKPTTATSSCTTAVTKFRETACVATTPGVAATTTKSTATTCISTAASSKAPGTTSTSSATVSCTTSTTKSATVSKPLERRTGAAATVTGTSYKAATARNTGSTVVREATCISAPAAKTENSNNSETASKTTVKPPSSVATAKMTQTSDTCENTEASAKTAHVKKYSVGSNSHESSAPAAPHLTTLTSVRSENKSPPTKPPHTSTSKTKPRECPPTVGLNQLIAVVCKEKQQVYCQLCSLRLKRSSHRFSFSHQYNYVKMKFPEWTAKPSEFENKLDVTVAHLAKVEKDVGTQKIDVEIDVYKDLEALPGEKAIERLKAMLRQRGSRLSSPTTNTAKVLRQQVAFASPFEASSPDDEENISQEEGQSDRAPSWKSPEPEANGLISAQLRSWPTLNTNVPEPIATPSIQNADIAVDKIEKPPGCADPLVSSSERAGRFSQTPDTCHKTAEKRQQQERSDPELQDTRKVLESTEKPSPVQFNPDTLSFAASVNTPQNIPTRHVPKHPGSSPGPVHHSASQALPRITIGESNKGSSHLSTYLMVKGLDTEAIIGLGSVWECQGITLPSFYLCESCRETLANNDICQHMVSDEHRVKYMWKQYPEFMSFWQEENLTQEMKLLLSNEIALKLSEREPLEKIDAQSVLLNKEMYELVQTAPFSEALKMLQNIKKQKLSALCLPTSVPRQKYQQPEDRQGGEESLITEMQSAQALERDQRSENEARPKTEKWHLEKTAKVGDSDGVKQRRVLSPLDVTSVVSKADSVVSPVPGARTCLIPQETFSSLSMRQEIRPPVSMHQRSIPKLQVKQAEVHSESSSSSTVCPKSSQTLSVSPRDKCLPTRKRPAVTSVEMHVGLGTNNPKLEEHLPAKVTRSSLQPISPRQSSPEYTQSNPTATSTLLSPEDKSTGPGSDEHNAFIVYLTEFANLMALVRERKAEMNVSPYMSAPDDAEITASSANNSSQSGVERRCHPKSQLVKATVKTEPPSTNLFECMFSTAAPLVSGHEDQLVTSNANSANNSSLEETKPVVTMLPSTSIVDPSHPQHQRSVNVDGTGGGHFPISAIVTTRSKLLKQFMGGYNGQNHTEMNRGNWVAHSFSTHATASPSDTFAASGGYGQYGQMTDITNGNSGYLSSEAVTGYTSPDNPPVYPGSLYQSEGHDRRGLYPSQIYSEQEANRFSLQSFGHGLATPMLPGWVGLEMHQQLMQHQYFSSASLAAGDSNVTNQAAYTGAVPFTIPANSSQRFINLNEYSTKRFVPTQESNNLLTQNTPLVSPNASGIHYPPTANSQILCQASANNLFASAGEFYAVAPSLVNAPPPVSHSQTN